MAKFGFVRHSCHRCYVDAMAAASCWLFGYRYDQRADTQQGEQAWASMRQGVVLISPRAQYYVGGVGSPRWPWPWKKAARPNTVCIFARVKEQAVKTDEMR